MEKQLRIISVLSSVKGNAHKATCYTINRETFCIKLNVGYKEVQGILKEIQDSKIILIEDINLSVNILNQNNTISCYKNIDYYYALFDVLSICMMNEARLTQESFHSECYSMQVYSCPSSIKLNHIEVRQGLTKMSSSAILKKEKYISKFNKKDLLGIVDREFKASIVGLFLYSFNSSIIALDFWSEEHVFGIMLDDYKVIPLKLNAVTYFKVCDVFGYHVEEN